MHQDLHLRAFGETVYIKKGGRRLANNEYCVDGSIQGLENYKKNDKGKLIVAPIISSGNIRKDRKIKTKKDKLNEKQLYGYFKRQKHWQDCQREEMDKVKKGKYQTNN